MASLLLIDGNSLTYRAFFALPDDMATASGQVTNAVFGFTSMLINVLKDHRPDEVLVAFDRPEPTFRHEADPDYKANRSAAPDLLRQQMGLVREVLTALGITIVDLAGWEADDIIATVAEEAAGRGDDVIIVTGDRDSYQLVADPHVKVLYNRRGVSDYTLYDEAGILERTGVTPALYPQYAALPRRPERQPARCSRRRREDRRQAAQRLRQPRRAVRPRRGADAEAARVARRPRGPCPQEPRDHGAAPRCADRRRLRRPGDQAQPDRGEAAVRVPRVPHPRRATQRGARRAGRRPAGDRDELVAELDRLTDPAAAIAALAGTRRRHRRRLGGRGGAHRSARSGCRHRRCGGRGGLDPGRPRHRPDVAAALRSSGPVRGHDVKPLLRSLLDLESRSPTLRSTRRSSAT